MINPSNIDELISKFLSGEASPEEAMLLEDWKEQSAGNRAHYAQSEKLFALLQPGLADQPDTDKAWQAMQSRINEGKVKPLYAKPVLLRVAAALLILVGAGLALALLFNKETRGVSYAAGNMAKEIRLSDGSEVTMAAHATLVADKDFGNTNRLMHLRGDASFSVVHDEAIPFTIDAGNVFIKDIGTRFTVRSSPDTDTVFVRVDEGVVLLFDSLGSSLEIKASEKALYIRSRKQIVKQETTIPKPASRLYFDKKPLGDVIAILNATYGANISLENAGLENCTITTNFEQENIETILAIITETLGLSYEKTMNGYLIKGKSCRL